MITLTPKSLLTYALSTFKQRVIRETQAFYKGLTFATDVIDTATHDFSDTLPEHVMTAFNGRFERGVKMAKQGMVSIYSDPIQPDKKRLFRVRSSNSYRPPYSYLVDLDNNTCECPDYMKGHFCKHQVASHIIELALKETGEVDAGDSILPYLGSNGSQKLEVPYIPGGKSIVWAAMRHNNEILGVEVLAIDGEGAIVRALPKILDGKKLQPQFPFLDGKSNLDEVSKEDLFHVKIFRHK